MYFYIMSFQVICILVSAICLYLAVADERLRAEKYGMAVLAVFSGTVLMEAGYGLYLQEIAMAGLRLAEKICLFGKLLTGIGFFMTCMSLSDRDSRAVRMIVGILGLTAAVFLFSDSFYRLLYSGQEFLQNQFFYYIETKRTMLGEIFHVLGRCLPPAGILWYVFYSKERRLSVKMLMSSGIFLWMISTVCQDRAFLRHYDADMPLGVVFTVCLIIFVAWDTKKVYTDCDLADKRTQDE